MGNGIIVWIFVCQSTFLTLWGFYRHLNVWLGWHCSTTVVGVVQAADGNMLDQVAALKAIADDMGNCIHNGYLTKCLIWQTL